LAVDPLNSRQGSRSAYHFPVHFCRRCRTHTVPPYVQGNSDSGRQGTLRQDREFA
jgi:hypothetical protein